MGQYQHDVDQSQLKKSLDSVVMSCVNSVGVNLNTASQHLLTYVSGLGPTLAKNIVEYRRENGAFSSRAQLKKVPRLGPSAYEQCAGFLRIPGARNPLDNSAVHPERYSLVETMAKDQGVTVKQLIEDKALQKKIEIRKYVSGEVGMPTLTDIMADVTFSDFGVGQRHCAAHRIFTGNHFCLTAAANTRTAGSDNRNVIAFQRLQ